MKEKRVSKIHFEGLRLIMRNPAISMAEKAILFDLLLYAGTNGEVFPSEHSLAQDMGITDRYVRTILTKLKNLNLINWERRFFTSNRYWFSTDIYRRISSDETKNERNSTSVDNGSGVPESIGTVFPDNIGTILPYKDNQSE